MAWVSNPRIDKCYFTCYFTLFSYECYFATSSNLLQVRNKVTVARREGIVLPLPLSFILDLLDILRSRIFVNVIRFNEIFSKRGVLEMDYLESRNTKKNCRISFERGA